MAAKPEESAIAKFRRFRKEIAGQYAGQDQYSNVRETLARWSKFADPITEQTLLALEESAESNTLALCAFTGHRLTFLIGPKISVRTIAPDGASNDVITADAVVKIDDDVWFHTYRIMLKIPDVQHLDDVVSDWVELVIGPILPEGAFA